MTTQSASRYVARHPEILQGEPIIAGTRTSVRAIVKLWRLGITPEEIPMHLPHLKLAQIFGSSKYVVSEYLLPQRIIIMMDHIPNSTNMVFYFFIK